LVLDGNKPENSERVDWEMFAAELAALKPAPPLFFEPRLAARLARPVVGSSRPTARARRKIPTGA
jgi:hypothetical protein